MVHTKKSVYGKKTVSARGAEGRMRLLTTLLPPCRALDVIWPRYLRALPRSWPHRGGFRTSTRQEE